MYVYVVNDQKKIVQKLIQVDGEIPGYFLIKEGVNDSDIILMDGLRKVHPGDVVEVKMLSTEELRSTLRLQAE